MSGSVSPPSSQSVSWWALHDPAGMAQPCQRQWWSRIMSVSNNQSGTTRWRRPQSMTVPGLQRSPMHAVCSMESWSGSLPCDLATARRDPPCGVGDVPVHITVACHAADGFGGDDDGVEIGVEIGVDNSAVGVVDEVVVGDGGDDFGFALRLAWCDVEAGERDAGHLDACVSAPLSGGAPALS